MRSWFFRIFSVLSLFVVFVFNMGEISEVGDMEWVYRAVPSNIPYAAIFLLNLAQSIIAVFLSSEFIKRDRKQDTTEVFYVRSMSNGTYLFGKAWSILSIFLLINVAALVMALIFNLLALNTSVDWRAYLYYPLLISLPTLVFVIGLSSLLMGIIRNQALTFVILVGYILSTLLYIRGSHDFLFDYMAYYQSLFHSSITGFGDWEGILRLRSMYTFFGLGFMFFSILILQRLPQSRWMNAASLALGLSFTGTAIFLGYQHLERYHQRLELPQQMIALNNEYLEHPQIDISEHQIELEQGDYYFTATSRIKGAALEDAREFVFNLNPGLQVQSVTAGGQSLDFKRELQLLFISWDRPVAAGTPLELTINYSGTIDETACYLDISPEQKNLDTYRFLFEIGQRYAYVQPEFLLLTPEAQWYPQAGVGYSDTSPFWYRKDFIDYQLTVKTLPGMYPVSQVDGRETADDTYLFAPEHALSQLSLSVGNYQKSSFEADSLTFSAYYVAGHDYFKDAFPDIRDTLPDIIRERLGDFERRSGLKYPFREFRMIEVPGQFKSFDRTWTSLHQTNQAGMVYIPEKGLYSRNLDFTGSVKRQSRWNQNRNLAPEELQMRVLRGFLQEFFRFKNIRTDNQGGNTVVEESINPYYQFVQFYELCNNLDAREWPVMNRIFESYLRVENDGPADWVRRNSGSTQEELANMVLQEKSFAEVLTLKENTELIDNVIELKGEVLFSMIQAQAESGRFREFITRLLEEYRFKNLSFETFRSRIQEEFGVDLTQYMENWFNQTTMPRFLIGTPIAEQVQSGNREMTRVWFRASNLGGAAGVIKSTLFPGDQEDKLLYLAPGQTKEVAYLSVSKPAGIRFNTLASGNLPNKIEYNFEKIDETTITNATEGQELADQPISLKNEGEIVVDNEDPDFEFTHYEEVSRLRKWLRPAGADGFKYQGTRVWRPPLNWTATTDDHFFGDFIRSAFYIKAGDGTKEAKWKVPVPEAGRYDVFYHVYKDDSFNWNRDMRGNYQFIIPHENGVDRPSIELTRESREGWVSLGDYNFPADTITITLSNESRLQAIFADAVKLVKRD
ncbi:hypothetical protein CRP01_16815 [Flavilitoribacter nigricans DSM 23189 = NBRC 102662]|uniref:Golvesin/Xly CBD-like domain-containing protein n=2 Tax=Flavilitoribacter TaxID=2762562 RepID=A0A2D0N9I2_FLAN2|nr:hypothetical protein CRP01_16815 [Flavilitoribacter nigricans DSM 23189 = NBRC 102662]